MILSTTLVDEICLRSLKALRGHSSELNHVVRVNSVGVNDSWRIGLLNWFLSYLDAVVDDEQRVVSPQHLIVQRNSVQVLLKQ